MMSVHNECSLQSPAGASRDQDQYWNETPSPSLLSPSSVSLFSLTYAQNIPWFNDVLKRRISSLIHKICRDLNQIYVNVGSFIQWFGRMKVLQAALILKEAPYPYHKNLMFLAALVTF